MKSKTIYLYKKEDLSILPLPLCWQEPLSPCSLLGSINLLTEAFLCRVRKTGAWPRSGFVAFQIPQWPAAPRMSRASLILRD